MKGQIQKIITIILIVIMMTIINNGIMVLADSIDVDKDNTINQSQNTLNENYEKTSAESLKEFELMTAKEIYDLETKINYKNNFGVEKEKIFKANETYIITMDIDGDGTKVGGITSVGSINNIITAYGPGTVQPYFMFKGNYTIDEKGNIRDAIQNIIGNIHNGDIVNNDGVFIAKNGVTVFPNGVEVDILGNTYNLDGTVTTAKGITYFTNGDVKDGTGTIYHVDGSISLPDGATKDVNGIVHYLDGSIMLPDGTKYFVDGAVISPGGLQINPLGQKLQNEVVNTNETPGSWKYNPNSNNWKFENVNVDGSKIVYKDKWINTKNPQGEETWYAVDADGNMITGWIKSYGEYYYMSKDEKSKGELVKEKITIDGKTYTFDTYTGALTIGEAPIGKFAVIGAINHVSGEDGRWTRNDMGEKCFVAYSEQLDGSQSEVPISGWYMVDGHYYCFDDNGVPETGLVIFDNKYYYLNSDGRMKEGGEVTIGNTTYIFDKTTGACITMRNKPANYAITYASKG